MEIELTDEDYYLFSNNEPENISNGMENWMDTDKYINFEEDSLPNCFSLKTDPLLSQVQIDENSTLGEEQFESVKSVPAPINSTKKILRKSKVKKQNVLTSHNKNKKKLRSSMPSTTSIGINNKKYKEDLLKERNIAALEMVLIRNGVGLFLKDSEMTQVFLTQHIKMTSLSAQHPVRHQFVKTINFQKLCDKTDVKLPQIITNIGSKIHLCPIRDCTEAFFQPALAKQHALKHLHVKPYKCSYPNCLWEFYTQSHLQRHQMTHEKRKTFICDYQNCNKEFTTIYNLSEHRKKTHLQPATKVCLVAGCNKTFRTEKELRSHCKVHSDNEAPYTCSIDKCKKSFFTQSTLQAHIKIHQFNNSTVCHFPNCGKSYNTPYRLKEHIRIHTGARPYKCKFEGCEWRFTTSSRLKRHEKVHSKEKKFMCPLSGCSKAFKRSEHLKEHSKTHIESPNKSNSCEICGMVYATKAAHMKKYHAELLKEDGRVIIEIIKDDNTPPTISIAEEVSIRTNNFEGTVSNINYDSVNNKSDEELLQEAIRSLGVPDLILEEEIMTSETLDMLGNDVSTVNLKDLD